MNECGAKDPHQYETTADLIYISFLCSARDLWPLAVREFWPSLYVTDISFRCGAGKFKISLTFFGAELTNVVLKTHY